MMIKFGRGLASLVALLVGWLVLADLFVSRWPDSLSSLNRITSRANALLVSWVAIVIAFALFLGFANVISVHWHRIRARRSGAVYSVVLLFSLAITLIVGFYFGGPNSSESQFIFNFVLQPLEATFFALLALFIASAAFRTFRIKIRNPETIFFVLFAVIVLLGQVPLGIYLWSEFPVIKDWILNVPALAGIRGILLGVALGTIATGLRILMGADRSYTD